MEDLVFNIIVNNVVRICKDYENPDIWADDCYQEDSLVIGLMKSSIIFKDLNMFSFLRNNWCPSMDIYFMVNLCKEERAAPFFPFLCASGMLIEYSYRPEEDD